MNTIYSYLDYRTFLADALKERKERNVHFSYRYIAQYLKLSSPGFFNWVISGKRKLPEALLPKLATLFKLGDDEQEYFSLLVKYNHETDIAARQKLFDQLSGLSKKQTKHRLQPRQYDLFSKWYYLAIRELIRIMQFRDDYGDLAKSLQPRIKTGEAREAIATLEKIGLISRDEAGICHPIETLLSTGETWESELITNLQLQLAELGKKAIVAVPKKERDISNLTVCLSAHSLQCISEDLSALRQKILTLSENDRNADRVYQCNLQLFPVSTNRTQGAPNED